MRHPSGRDAVAGLANCAMSAWACFCPLAAYFADYLAGEVPGTRDHTDHGADGLARIQVRVSEVHRDRRTRKPVVEGFMLVVAQVGGNLDRHGLHLSLPSSGRDPAASGVHMDFRPG